MKPKKLLLLIIIFFSLHVNLSAWTSSNEGVCYTMDTLVQLSNYITYNTIDQMYEVDCDITILGNDTLKILSGETVVFISYITPYTIKRGLIIYGCLNAVGTDEEPIHLGDPEATFTAGSGHWWNGIDLINTSKNGESILKHCTLRAVKHIDENKETAIYCENASPIIDHCTILYMGTNTESGGCSAIGLIGQSYPIVSYCTFKNILRGIAIWCNVYMWQDTINYPSPLVYGCNIESSIQSFFWFPCDYDIVVLNGGFLDNCYIGAGSFADTTLGLPIDTIGDGICNTISTFEPKQKFYMVDGVVNPRGDTLLTDINYAEIDILPTTTEYITLYTNYPNPVSDYTTIEFEVKSNNSIVSMLIYDSKGKCVKKLIKNQKYSSGKYSVIWNADDTQGIPVRSGIYFYKLISNEKMLVKKAIVIK